MVQANLDPDYALAKDLQTAKDRLARLEALLFTAASGGGSFTVSATAPASPTNGAGWYNLSNGLIFFYVNDGDSSQWVQDTSIANDAGYDSRITALETFNTVAQAVSVGGTGASTLAAGGYLKGNGTSAVTSQVGIPGSDITAYMSPNVIINGGLDIWQRGTSFTSSGYTADRWYSPIAGTTTVSQETASLPAGFRYGIKFVTGAASSYAEFNQAFESATVIPLQGQTVTASGWVKISGPYSGNWSFDAKYSTSSDAYASQTTQVSGSAAVIGTAATTSWTRFSKTFTVPSNAVGLRLEHFPDALQPSGVTVTMTGMQLELGSVATPFRRNANSIQGELAACQRYYWRFTATQSNARMAHGFQLSTTAAEALVPVMVELRAIPLVGFSNLWWTDGVGWNAVVSAITLYFSGNQKDISLYITYAANGVARQPGVLSAQAAGSYLELSAEL